MSKRRISTSDIIVGQPLPWNVFGEDGRLLLRKGETVATESQVEFMVRKGLFSEVEDASGGDEIKISPKEPPSVIRMLNSANRLLRKALPALLAMDNAQEKVMDIATLIYDALELNPDIAVASIFLNHEAGPYVYRHCVDTGVVAALIARSMNKPSHEIKVCICAALTSNLGMLDYQEHLDNKKEPLTQAEKDHIRKHPFHSAEMLLQAGISDEAWLSYVRDHHENEDGSGYPNGKPGDQISVYAKLIGLADRYCARVTGKDYRKQALPNGALRDIFLSKNKEIDPLLAPYFIKNIGLYPPGSFVRLKNDEIAVVVKKGDNPSNPTVMTVINKLGLPPDTKLVRDTANPFFGIKEAVHREIAGAKLQMLRVWGEQAAY